MGLHWHSPLYADSRCIDVILGATSVSSSPPRPLSEAQYFHLQVIDALNGHLRNHPNFRDRPINHLLHLNEGAEVYTYLVEFLDGASIVVRVPRPYAAEEAQLQQRVIASFPREMTLMRSLQTANHPGLAHILPIREMIRIRVNGEELPVQILPARMSQATQTDNSVPNTFDRYLSRYGRDGHLLRPPLEILRVWRQMALAALALHSLRDATYPNGVAHLDIKPTNIFVTEVDGQIAVQLGDLGAHAQMGRLQEGINGSIIASHPYVAPERLRLVPHTTQITPAEPAQDVYSLLVVYYASVLGREPGESFRTMDNAVLNALPPQIQRVLRLFPESAQRNSRINAQRLLQEIDRGIQELNSLQPTPTSVPVPMIQQAN